jgi:hypothetical protein
MTIAEFLARTEHLPASTIVRSSSFDLEYTLKRMKISDSNSFTLDGNTIYPDFTGSVGKLTLGEMRTCLESLNPKTVLEQDVEDGIIFGPIGHLVEREGFLIIS